MLHVVSRTWTHLLAEAAGCPIDPRARIPAQWRQYASRRTGQQAPEVMTEGSEPEFARYESGYDPADPVHRRSWPPVGCLPRARADARAVAPGSS